MNTKDAVARVMKEYNLENWNKDEMTKTAELIEEMNSLFARLDEVKKAIYETYIYNQEGPAYCRLLEELNW